MWGWLIGCHIECPSVGFPCKLGNTNCIIGVQGISISPGSICHPRYQAVCVVLMGVVSVGVGDMGDGGVVSVGMGGKHLVYSFSMHS